MRLSLNEFQATIHKAARGAGFAAGLADELVQAASWLARYGFDGDRATIKGLQTGPRQTMMGRIGPSLVTTSHFHVVTDAPSLFDLAAASDRELRGLLTNVDAPLLALGYAGVAARTYGISSELQYGSGTRVIVDASDLNIRGEIPVQKTDLLVICESEEQSSLRRPVLDRVTVDKDTWQELEKLAAKTYVPATDASRLAGAGAGLTDND